MFRPMVQGFQLMPLGLAAALGGVTTAGVISSIPDEGGVIHACYMKETLRVIDPLNDSCKINETPLTWNQTGPQGPQGPSGGGEMYAGFTHDDSGQIILDLNHSKGIAAANVNWSPSQVTSPFGLLTVCLTTVTPARHVVISNITSSSSITSVAYADMSQFADLKTKCQDGNTNLIITNSVQLAPEVSIQP